jgi:hypothetical protein
MGMIDLNKKYDKFVTFGCSYSNGHELGITGSWGFIFSKLLNCKHYNYAFNGSSNNLIMNNVIKFCESNNLENIAIGVQWSEWSRRELWSETEKTYKSFNLPTLEMGNFTEEKSPDMFFIKKHQEFFSSIWFDYKENILRTIQSMILIKNYLENKNIDFVMFEGLGSILDMFYPNKEQYSGHNDLTLLSDEFKLSILNHKCFFSKLGDMRTLMKPHSLYENINDGHPNPKFLEWWCLEMYNDIKEKYENNSNWRNM